MPTYIRGNIVLILTYISQNILTISGFYYLIYQFPFELNAYRPQLPDAEKKDFLSEWL